MMTLLPCAATSLHNVAALVLLPCAGARSCISEQPPWPQGREPGRPVRGGASVLCIAGVITHAPLSRAPPGGPLAQRARSEERFNLFGATAGSRADLASRPPPASGAPELGLANTDPPHPPPPTPPPTPPPPFDAPHQAACPLCKYLGNAFQHSSLPTMLALHPCALAPAPLPPPGWVVQAGVGELHAAADAPHVCAAALGAEDELRGTGESVLMGGWGAAGVEGGGGGWAWCGVWAAPAGACLLGSESSSYKPPHPQPPTPTPHPHPLPPTPPPHPTPLSCQAKEEMRSKEALLKNFFCNVEVVLRTHKVAATSQRWEVSRPAAGRAGALF